MENRYKIIYDIKTKISTNIRFKQGNTNSSVLEVKFTDNGKAISLTEELIEFRFLKSDGTIVYQDISTGVALLEGTTGTIECILMTNTLSTPGLVKCEIHSTKNSVLLNMPTFYFTVENEIGADGVLSTNYISSIESKLVEWQNKVDLLKDGIDGTDGTNGLAPISLTQAEYDALSDAKLTDNIYYAVIG